MIIWVIGRNYPLPENNMQGSFEFEQAKLLAKYGHDVHYLACSLHPIKKIKKAGIQSWTEDGVKVTVCSKFFVPRIYPLYFIRERNKYWGKLFNAVKLKSGIPDVIHVHYPAMLMIADALKYFHDNGVQVVATEHWTKVLWKRLDRIELREYKKYCNVLHNIICVGSPLKNSVRDLIGMDGKVVPNVVNELFKPTTEKHKGYRFVVVGRLIKLKQFDRVIEAFCDCFLGESCISLTIIGEGEEKENLRKIIEARSANSQVMLLGNQTRDATAKIVSNSDCLICYSTYETFGVPIIEAWECGLTTITTNTAAATIDYFDERLGVKVESTDFDGLKKALRYVYEHQGEYNKEFIYSYANNHFSEKVIYSKLINLYGISND